MRLRHLALPAAAGLTLLAIPFAPAATAVPATCPTPDNPCVVTFEATGSLQTFVVPDGVTNLLVALSGAAGGAGLQGDEATGGAGGALEAIVPVTPGETLSLVVGGKGGDAVAVDPGESDDPPIPAVAAGGYGGGGNGTAAIDGPVGGGGGGSFVFTGAGALLVAAGGGGGAGYTGDADAANSGGAGGSAAGATAPGANGGGGASATGGGAPGAGDATIGAGTGGTGPATSPTAFGNGGAAQGTCSAGGGGGGFYGGGSGGCDTTAPANTKVKGKGVSPAVDIATIYSAGGGGGGAGFVGNGASTVLEGPGSTGDGAIVLGYTTSQTKTTLSATDTTLAPGEEATLNAKVTGDPTVIGDPTSAASAAGKVAKAAFGAQAKALAVPNQPAADGTTVNPGTACGSTPCTVTFFVNGTKLGNPISIDAATGTATVVFTAGSEQGVRNVTARYDGNLYYLQSLSNPVAITVAGLANTGPSNVEPMIGAAAALLVAGAGLVVYGRRRPQLGSHRAA